MTLMRYWVYTMLLALAGGFLMLETLSFGSASRTSVALGVAVAATVVSFAAFDAIPAGRRIAKGLAAASMLAAALTVIGQTGLFSAFTEKWIAFTGGAVILGLALVSLTMHEVTTERVVHELEVAGNKPATEPSKPPVHGGNDRVSTAVEPKRFSRQRILRSMRLPVPYWLYSIALALAGGFLIIETLAFTGTTISSIALGVAIGATVLSLAALVQVQKDRLVYRVLAGASTLVAALVVISQTGLASISTQKWLAFAGGAALLGIALVSLTLHEIYTERVVHELEIAEREHKERPAAVG